MPKRSKYEQAKSVLDFKNAIESKMNKKGDKFKGLPVREFLEDNGMYTDGKSLAQSIGRELSKSKQFYHVMRKHKKYGNVNHWFLKEE